MAELLLNDQRVGGVTNQVAINSADLTAAVPFYGRQPASEDVPKIKASLLLMEPTGLTKT